MNIYIVPIYDGPDIWIERIVANSLEQAEDHLYYDLYDRYEFAIAQDFDSLRIELAENGIMIGDLYDLEDFTG